MKKNYTTPILEVSEFEAEDILTASVEAGGADGDIGAFTPIQWEDEIANG